MKAIIRIPSHFKCFAVDDNEGRLDWFLSKLPNCTTAVSPNEAIMTLDTIECFDIIFLDHDCDGKYFADPNDPEFLNKSFWRVAQHLHSTKYNGQVIVHSGNPVGAKRMADFLKDVAEVTVLPFGTFDIEINDLRI